MSIPSWLPFAILALLGWGITAFLPKLTLKSLTPRNVIVYQSVFFAISACVLQLFFGVPEFQLRGVVLATATGFFGLVGQLVYLEALRRGPLMYVSMISSLYPLVATALAYFLLQTPVTPKQGAGIVLGIFSIVLLVVSSDK